MAGKRSRPLMAANGRSKQPVVAQTNGTRSITRKGADMHEDGLREGMKKLARRQVERSIAGTVKFKEVDQATRSKVDESRTVVVNGDDIGDAPMSDGVREPIEISTDEGDGSRTSESEGDDEDEDAVGNEAERRPASDHEMADADPETQLDDGAEGEPTFGDLVAATALRPVDVEASFDDPQDHSKSLTAAPTSKPVQIPSATSLATVLSQALRTNDHQLLESCLHMSDILAIRSTVQRLESSLATTLLSKLAERLHLRPNRAGHLMIWIQWTLVSHGGYLAGQPELMRKLGALHNVLRERAVGLQPLLALKGKLDMLEAQMELRKSLKGGLADRSDLREEEEGEDEQVIYVEGQRETDTEDDGEAADAGTMVDMADFSQDEDDDDDEDEDEEMPTTNGVIADSEESSDLSESEDEDLVDDEAEETDADTGDEGEDEDNDGEDEDEGPGEPVSEDQRVEVKGKISSKPPKKRRR